MDTSKVLALVEQLDDHIEDLDDILQPLLTQALSETDKKLPVLDRAKLHVTLVYAIESLLFSYLKLGGVDAREHPVFRELTRVKQYFEKIKEAENGTSSLENRKLKVDKQAAFRMIKHSLSGNTKIDLEHAEAEARQKLLAKRKLKVLEDSMKEKAASNDQSPSDIQITTAEEQEIADLVASAAQDISAADSLPSNPATPDGEPAKSKKKSKKRKQEQTVAEGQDVPASVSKKSRGEKRKIRKERKGEQNPSG